MIQCNKCDTIIIINDAKFCSNCGAELAKPQIKPVQIKDEYADLYGTWEVSTEGDCEGISIHRLGTHMGFVDQIARKIANSKNVGYSLHFKKVDIYKEYEPNKNVKSVNISFDIDSDTWDIKPAQWAVTMQEVFKDRPVSVEESNSYAAFSIVFND